MKPKGIIYGWGINDATYPIELRDKDGKRIVCPIYQCWKDMIKRCHYPPYQARCKTYIGCRVDERWRLFMAFRYWHLEQAPGLGEHLDKDFFGDGKLYSPETCCFVSPWLNGLFCDHAAARGIHPQGVYFHKMSKKYEAQISMRGKRVHLGLFDTSEEASEVYLKAKATYVEELLIEFPQPPRLADAIRRKMIELIEHETELWHVSLKA